MIYIGGRLLSSTFCVGPSMNVSAKFIVSVFKLNQRTVGHIKPLSTSCKLNIKVAVCGSSGGVGQPLSLLLKMSPHIDELALYDIAQCVGVATDLSHINTKAKVKHYGKATLLGEALEKKDIIVIAAGKPRDPGMTRADLFQFNASVVAEITESMTKTSPKAMLCLITNPVNSLIPVAAGILSKANVYDPKKLFGITTLDCVRASTFASELLCYDPSKLAIPVIGGHSGVTIVPVFSQSSAPIDLPKDKLVALIERVQNGGTEVVEAKQGAGSATLSTAYAGARFVFALCRAIKGERHIVECAMVQSDVTDAAFFANPLVLGPKGVKKNLGYGKLNPDECCLLTKAVKDLVVDIEVGKKFLEKDEKGQGKVEKVESKKSKELQK